MDEQASAPDAKSLVIYEHLRLKKVFYLYHFGGSF